MFQPEDICVNLVNDAEVKMWCGDLQSMWDEMGYDSSKVNQEKENIINEIKVIVKRELSSMKVDEEQHLRKHRVLTVRTELGSWWTKCYLSEQQKQEFQPYFSEEFTDELLKVHQNELKKMKEYYADNLHLFQVIQQYMKLYERHLNLEIQSKNPNRLFENRGGQLLKDERDRKAAKKDLPKYEKEIASLTEQFKKKFGRAFTMNGTTFQESLKDFDKKFKENYENFIVPEVKPANLGSGLKRKLCLAVTPGKGPVTQPKVPRTSSRKVLT